MTPVTRYLLFDCREVRHLVDGRDRAGLTLENMSIEHPRDALARQAGHQIDFFFTGDPRKSARPYRARSAGVERGHAGSHAILGMYAFGPEGTRELLRLVRNIA